MSSKKYKLMLLTLCTFLAIGTFAQKNTSVYDVYDSAVITKKGQPQQNEFWNNHYDFPAKPRNQWEIGASLSTITESSDIPSVFPTLPSFEVHVRKALGYVFSLRLQYTRGIAKGLNWNPSDNYRYNSAWVADPNSPFGPNKTLYVGGPNAGGGIDSYNPAGSSNPVNHVFYNYKTLINDLSLEGLITLNNIRFHKQKTGFNIYAGGGIGLTWYHATVNAGRDDGTNYNTLFSAILNGVGSTPAIPITYDNRSKIIDALKNGYGGIPGMDNTYESRAESEASRRPTQGDGYYTLKPSGTVLVGIAYKLSNRINLQLEDRQTFVKTDLLDGQRWAEQVAGSPVLTPDYDSYNVLSLGINFNLGGKAVEPLYWLNPLDYAYSELNNPKHMNFPKPKFDDADGDGVVDQLDKEPNTPAGAPVDTHGVSRDTDGDGVPDYKDKQLITPTECQPVDADGVGKCPPPPCCDSLKGGFNPKNACPTDYPSVSFKGNGIGLSGDAKALLATVAAKMKESPDCSVKIVGYPGASKARQSLADKRLAAITKYLVETLGISADRITTDKVIGGGDEGTFDIKSN
ncbi:OmpA family protein [Ferruginibacter albus]|uniref:OmpA family protein n=1 Tax=Ferruginibacter albus TaxID=2875540 RepID=UPI001CC6FDE3|nr:hypothetical protein [Ferruginibacter albus]UAY52665.1 hypothetical protein K9M53_02980 [Ferruginibacter albus]